MGLLFSVTAVVETGGGGWEGGLPNYVNHITNAW